MFFKKVNLNSNKECFEFLANHFTYHTLNSWNGLRSIAHNVKIYRLPGVDLSDALTALEEDNYATINMCIEDWESEHPGYKVGFNGRSSGYLVLYREKDSQHVFEEEYNSPCKYEPDQYEDWKADVISDWGSLKNYHPTLVEQVKLVQDFDKLCDTLIDVLIELIKEMHHRHEQTFEWHATKAHEHYTYDTLEDLRHHEQYMLQQGYKVWDKDEDYLYVEYELNKHVEGQVTLED